MKWFTGNGDLLAEQAMNEGISKTKKNFFMRCHLLVQISERIP